MKAHHTTHYRDLQGNRLTNLVTVEIAEDTFDKTISKLVDMGFTKLRYGVKISGFSKLSDENYNLVENLIPNFKDIVNPIILNDMNHNRRLVVENFIFAKS